MKPGLPVEGSITRLIGDLHSLCHGEQTVARLIGCGEPAIEPLREFLLQGRPSSVYEPRRWAVEALAGLGAWHVLVEYLLTPRQIADPVARFGEEAVESAAARELAAWRTESVFRLLLDLAHERFRVGLIEALGEFRRTEAIPVFDRALEDDYYRSAAEQALRRLGPAARPALVLSAVTPLPNAVAESTSSLRRRRSVLTLLAEMGIAAEDAPALRPLADSADPELVVGAVRLVAPFAAPGERFLLARRLLEVLYAAGWFLQDDIETCLMLLEGAARKLVDDQVRQRMHLPAEERAADSALHTLLRVQRRLGGKEARGRLGTTAP